MDPRQRYINIIRWARRRYTDRGVLILHIGGVPSPYTRIEQAAMRRLTRDIWRLS